MVADLHLERIDVVLARLLKCGARSVLDLGCGSGSLLLRLIPHEQFQQIVGIDISTQEIALARERLGLGFTESGNRGLTLMQGSFTEKHSTLRGFDAAVLLETIEHIEPSDLSRVEGAVFSYYRPETILITTPNKEYNPLLGQPQDIPRRSDHHFEWGRDKFLKWSQGVARRNRYTVSVSGIGPSDRRLGCPTQIAEFKRCDAETAIPNKLRS